MLSEVSCCRIVMEEINSIPVDILEEKTLLLEGQYSSTTINSEACAVVMKLSIVIHAVNLETCVVC